MNMTEKLETLTALVECFIPSQNGAGALETNAVTYLTAALSKPNLKGFLPLLDTFIATLEQASVVTYGQSFALIDKPSRDAVLSKIIANKDRKNHSVASYLLHLTIEGFFCHPRHGGNRERAGWAYLGFKPNQAGLF